MTTLFDGFEMQRLLAQEISENESKTEHLHIAFTDMLTCTFNENEGVIMEGL